MDDLGLYIFHHMLLFLTSLSSPSKILCVYHARLLTPYLEEPKVSIIQRAIGIVHGGGGPIRLRAEEFSAVCLKGRKRS